MRTVTITIKGTSPYSASRYHETEKLERESPDDYARRVWREQLHTNGDGTVIIPGIQLKKALAWMAGYLSETIPGKGKKTWTKFFMAGTMPITDLHLGVKPDAFECVPIRCGAQGARGGGQVTRYFPQISKWGGPIDFAILDDTITREVFERYVSETGRYCGLGRWRPANGGMNGRFEATKFDWK